MFSESVPLAPLHTPRTACSHHIAVTILQVGTRLVRFGARDVTRMGPSHWCFRARHGATWFNGPLQVGAFASATTFVHFYGTSPPRMDTLIVAGQSGPCRVRCVVAWPFLSSKMSWPVCVLGQLGSNCGVQPKYVLQVDSFDPRVLPPLGTTTRVTLDVCCACVLLLL